MKNLIINLYVAVFLISLTSCGKEFLDIKRNANQVVPHTVKDYLAIISRNNMLTSANAYAFFGSDEYYLVPSALSAVTRTSPHLGQVYLWGDEVYGTVTEHTDWNAAYEVIMYCNLALDVEKHTPKEVERDDWNRTRLAARYHRAWSFYQLAQLFCEVYEEGKAAQKLGLPLRLDYDLSVRYQRATLEETYNQILKDLHEAEDISVAGDLNTYLPGPLAVRALLARIYLQMGNFDRALYYADLVLSERDGLVDFNALTGSVANEGGSYFPAYGVGNPEVILYMNRGPGGLVGATRFNASPEFLSTYAEGDLRRKIYFFRRSNGTHAFIGSYNGQGGNALFSGPAIDELLLIRAECRARAGKMQVALDDLNRLRAHRFTPASYHELSLNEVDDMVRVILDERKKELYMRGLRWEDARRLNREGRYPVGFERELDGEYFRLEPGSSKWIWPLPPGEVAISNLFQNNR